MRRRVQAVKHPAIGVVITSKYKLERPLASGGMGSVWVARHIELGMPVAIKFMSPELVGSGEARMRFEREAKAAALLQSPYVVSVQDYGVDDHLPYIVMEFMRGEDLEDRLTKRGRLSPSEVWTIASQVAKGLRRAHEMGIVHRDLKPRNLFLAQHDEDETIKILDFGIAKARSPQIVTEATATGSVMGSPLYMSPEQVRGAKDVDLRTDLWSFGVVLFQLLTGHTPFRGEVVGDVIGKILADPIPRVTSFVPDLPPALNEFFDRALARDRAQRFQSVREMVDALGDIVRPSSAPSPAVIVTLAQPPLHAPITERLPSAPPATESQPEGVGAPQEGATGLAAITTTVPLATPTPSPRPSESQRVEGTGSTRGRSFPWIGVTVVAAGLSVAITIVMLVIPEGGGRPSGASESSASPVAAEIAPEHAKRPGPPPAPSAEPAAPPLIVPASGSASAAASVGPPAAPSASAPRLAASALAAASAAARVLPKITPKPSTSVDSSLGF